MILERYNRAEIREIARSAIESFEGWLRRWINNVLTSEYGADYFNHVIDGEYVFKRSLVSGLEYRVSRNPARYPRKVDALLLEDSINIICHPKFYPLFKPVLDAVFPLTNATTIRGLLRKLVATRNRVSHVNEISWRETYRVLSYSSDIIVEIKKFFQVINQGKNFNVPTIIKASDSLGVAWFPGQGEAYPQRQVYPNDSITMYIEIDPSFPRESYVLRWRIQKQGASSRALASNASSLTYVFEEKDIGLRLNIFCEVVELDKTWHVHGNYDDRLQISFQVLPFPQ